jgi:folate-binding protein YgfZ
MTQITLHSTEARRAVYNGAETVAAFTDPASELRALTSGCGVFELGWRAKIMVTDEDRVRWLNGMVTNNIKDLPLNHGNYNFLLSSQGRILADMYIYNRGEYLLLDTDRSQLETVMKTLDHFIIMDDVELKESSLSATGLCGPKAAQVLASAGVEVSSLEPLEIHDLVVNEMSISLVRGPEQKPGWYEIWQDRLQVTGDRGQEDRQQAIGNRQQQNPLTTEDTEERRGRLQGSEKQQQEQPQEQNQQLSDNSLFERLVAAGAQPVGTEALELWRIIHGIPRYGQDIRERDLPQETEQNQALNFTKGCYIGQEIVERIRSRGQVHRKFTGFEFQDALPPLGKFEEEGRVMGEITSVAEVGGKKIGLGYVRRETGLPGRQFTVGGVVATVVTPPFGN